MQWLADCHLLKFIMYPGKGTGMIYLTTGICFTFTPFSKLTTGFLTL